MLSSVLDEVVVFVVVVVVVVVVNAASVGAGVVSSRGVRPGEQCICLLGEYQTSMFNDNNNFTAFVVPDCSVLVKPALNYLNRSR